MTKEETKKAIEVMQAWVDGKEVQAAAKESSGWITLISETHTPPLWDWFNLKYRIKPEPMEIEVWVSPHRELSLYKPHSLGNLEWTPKTFREVV